MNIIKYLVLILILVLPINSYAGGGSGGPAPIDDFGIMLTDDRHHDQHVAYYDLRNRSSLVQVTNVTGDGNCPIHVQIFQHDRGCDELNFNDTLTPNDTVVYDMDNIIKNDGSPAPINLADDSYGYVVISGDCNMIGNFRIADDSGYEYRTNTVTAGRVEAQEDDSCSTSCPPDDDDAFCGSNLDIDFYANFNTVDGAMFSDVVGFAFDRNIPNTVTNIDKGVSFDIFVYDLHEEPLSCDRRNFACGNVMNYGVNEDYSASRGDDLLCPGGGLVTDQKGGYVLFTNPDGFNNCDHNEDGDSDCASDSDGSEDADQTLFCAEDGDMFVGLIGINNGDGTGSMDIWQLLSRNAILVPQTKL